MKHTLLILAIMVSGTLAGQTTNPAPYCPHEYDDGMIPTPHYISSFHIAGFTNVSGTIQQPFPHYIFYNDMAGPLLVRLQTYSYTVAIDTLGSNKTVILMFDWNSNGVFEASEVLVHAGINAGVAIVNGVVTVPFVLANSRLRIAYVDDAIQSNNVYCTTTLDWGETEDYQLQVVNGITDLNEASASSNSMISLNTENGSVFIHSATELIENIQLYNLSSQLVFENSACNSTDVEIKSIKNGLYILQSKTRNNIFRQKIYIED